MTRVGIDVDPDDRFSVRVRPDLDPDRGGLAFVDLGSAHFLLNTPRLRELHGLITAAFEQGDTLAPARLNDRRAAGDELRDVLSKIRREVQLPAGLSEAAIRAIEAWEWRG